MWSEEEAVLKLPWTLEKSSPEDEATCTQEAQCYGASIPTAEVSPLISMQSIHNCSWHLVYASYSVTCSAMLWAIILDLKQLVPRPPTLTMLEEAPSIIHYLISPSQQLQEGHCILLFKEGKLRPRKLNLAEVTELGSSIDKQGKSDKMRWTTTVQCKAPLLLITNKITKWRNKPKQIYSSFCCDCLVELYHQALLPGGEHRFQRLPTLLCL